MEPISPAHGALGDAIREARNEQRIAQDETAMRAGLDRAYFAEIERAQKNVGFTNLLKVAEGLGMKPSELLVRAERLGLLERPSREG
jgi:transcriptional regulator with XRE-family HTH domain